MNKEQKEKLKLIKSLVFDIDGVMTDGQVLAMNDGSLLRSFNIKDGQGIVDVVSENIPVGIISRGTSESVIGRFRKLGIKEENIMINIDKKIDALKLFCERNQLTFEQIGYMGDDTPDIPILKVCGFSACPEDAVDKVKSCVDYISPKKGGHGAVRDLIDEFLNIKE